MGRVQDRVAVVTGGANGFGQAIACRLAGEGARVVLGDLEPPGSSARRPRSPRPAAPRSPWPAISPRRRRPQRLIDACVERFGRARHPRQRRRRQPQREDLGDGGRGLGLRPAPESPQSTFLCTRGGGAAHDAAALRPHRLHVLGRPRGHAVDRLLPGRLRLLGGQGRRARLHPRRGAGAGRVRHQRQRGGAGADRHRAVRARAQAAERDGGVQPEPHDAAAPARASPSRSRTPCCSWPPTRPATSPATRWRSPAVGSVMSPWHGRETSARGSTG